MNESNQNPHDKSPIVAHSKQGFLSSMIQRYTSEEKGYNLEEEFAKSKKNRSILQPLLLILIIVMLGGVLVGVTLAVNQTIDSIQFDEIDRTEFNVRTILDVIASQESELRTLNAQLRSASRDLQWELSSIADREQRSLILLRNQELTEEVRLDIESQIRAESQRQRDEANQRFDTYSDEVELMVEQRRLREESAEIQAAQEQLTILNPQRVKTNLEIARIIEEYEAEIGVLFSRFDARIDSYRAFSDELARNLIEKYNPVFEESYGEMLNEEIPPTGEPLAEIPSNIVTERLITQQEQAQLRQAITGGSLLMDRMIEIPYINTVPRALEQIELRASYSIATLHQILSETAHLLQERTRKLEQFESALDFIALSDSGSGYIIDADDPEAIRVHTTKISDPGPEAIAYVYRETDLLALIGFRIVDDDLVGYLIEQYQPEEIQPFDQILLSIEQEQEE